MIHNISIIAITIEKKFINSNKILRFLVKVIPDWVILFVNLKNG